MALLRSGDLGCLETFVERHKVSYTAASAGEQFTAAVQVDPKPGTLSLMPKKTHTKKKTNKQHPALVPLLARDLCIHV